ncbi:MAG TPA: hypothetical protein VM901_02615 [Bdellovibrionota bacterium]|jgi:hypothetical protein|nr:hypothetical protein [Bdellovibrionota bacterium]
MNLVQKICSLAVALSFACGSISALAMDTRVFACEGSDEYEEIRVNATPSQASIEVREPDHVVWRTLQKFYSAPINKIGFENDYTFEENRISGYTVTPIGGFPSGDEGSQEVSFELKPSEDSNRWSGVYSDLPYTQIHLNCIER